MPSGPAVSIIQEEAVKRIVSVVPVESDGSVYFVAPSGKTHVVPGFLWHGFERKQNGGGERLAPTGEYGWRVWERLRWGGTEAGEAEPEIYDTTRRFGTILENVVLDPDSRVLDLDDDSLTENTRAAYAIDRIPNASATGTAGHPRNLIMLTADAFGVLPPVARLTPAQAMYHFISGYTAKVAGTERGVDEPQATFSACFGAPFLALKPTVYSRLLGEKVTEHQVRCWLINTGWTGGPYGVGSRISIAHTRALVEAALDGKLDDACRAEAAVMTVLWNPARPAACVPPIFR